MTLLGLVGGLDSYYRVKYLPNTHKKNIDFDSFIFTVSYGVYRIIYDNIIQILLFIKYISIYIIQLILNDKLNFVK